MAPEILRYDEHYDASVDVFAFSILAYQVITGKSPYFELGGKIKKFSLAHKVINSYRPKRVDGITNKMWSLLCRC